MQQRATTASGSSVARPGWRESRSLRSRAECAAIVLVLVLGSALMLAPLVWMVSTALKETGREFTYPPEWIPNPVALGNYPTALTLVPFRLYFANTLTITFAATTGILLTSSMVAFGFARLRFPGRRLLFGLLVSTMMLPSAVTLIPQFILFKTLGWYDTFLPMVVPHWFGGGAFNIFLIRQFFMTIPYEMDEAARIDGASSFTIYWRILLPLSGPVLATVGVLGFMYFWNDFLSPLIYISSMDKRTLAVGIQAFRGLYVTNWNLMMAASSVMVVPVIALFFAAQRYFVRGVVLTGIAGR